MTVSSGSDVSSHGCRDEREIPKEPSNPFHVTLPVRSDFINPGGGGVFPYSKTSGGVALSQSVLCSELLFIRSVSKGSH